MSQREHARRRNAIHKRDAWLISLSLVRDLVRKPVSTFRDHALPPVTEVAGQKTAVAVIGETLLRRRPGRPVRLHQSRPLRCGRGSRFLVAGRIRRGGADHEQDRESKKKAMHGFSAF
jgi:hypothetical protein